MNSESSPSLEENHSRAGHRRAAWILFGITMLWGSTFSVIKVLLGEIDYSFLLLYRFGLGTAVLWVICRARGVRPSKEEWRAGGALAVFLFGGYLTQTLGLQWTTPSKSAFITAMTVAFVPVISIFIEKAHPHRSSIIGVMLSILGMLLLVRPQGQGVNPGDLLTLACAVLWSIYIVQLPIMARRFSRLSLLFVQMAGMTLGCLGTVIVEGVFLQSEPMHWLPSATAIGWIVYLALGCTLLTTGLQTFYQRGTTSTRAALIYALEPVAASSLAFFWLGDRLTPPQMIGAAVVLGGVLVAELDPLARRAPVA